MCNPFSCIATRGGQIFSQVDDPSHTEIARLNNLPEDGKSELYRAKIEVVPRDGHTFAEPPDKATWIVVVDEPSCPDWYSDRTERAAMAAALTWWKSRVIAPDSNVCVAAGVWFVLEGAPTITQSGGEVRTFDSSAPTITQSGGVVRTYDSSAPTITQSGGEVRTYDSSAPTITQSGGEVVTYGSSAPTITQSGGEVVTYDSSAPTITQSGGVVVTFGSSAPTITQSGGEVVTFDSSAPTITQSGGEVRTTKERP